MLAALTLLPSVALAQTPPAAPSSVTLARANGTVTASWPEVSNAAGYHITYSSDGENSWTAAPCGTNCTVGNNGVAVNEGVVSITISGVDNAKTYVVGVRASDNGGQWSGWTNSAPIAPQLPAAPGSVTLTRSAGQLTVAWTAVSEATSYNINLSGDGTNSWTRAESGVTGTGNTITKTIDSGIENWRWYIAAVQSVNSKGAGGWTNSDFVAPIYTPGQVRDLSATRSGTGISVTWDAPANNGGSAVTGYDVNYTVDGVHSWTRVSINQSATSATISDVSNAVGYVVAVRANNGVGEGAWTNSAPVAGLAGPSSVTAIKGGDYVEGEWSAVAGATGYDVNLLYFQNEYHYRIETNMSGTSRRIYINDGSYFSPEQFVIAVRARNAHGPGAWTNSPPATPPPPPTLTASSITRTGVTLTIGNHTAAWHYKSTTAGKTDCTIVPANTASVTMSGLTPATEYIFTAYSDNTCTTTLATAAAFTTPGIALNPVAGVSVTEGSTAIYTVKLATQPTHTVIVILTGSTTAPNNDASITITNPSNKTLTFTDSTWNTAQTVTLTAAADSDSLNGKRDIKHTATSGDTLYDTATATLTATESDTTAGITLTPSSLNITEGGNATYTIKLNTAPTHDVTITVAAGTDSDDDTDITIKDTDDGLDGDQTGTITFTSSNWNTARTITLAAATDTDAANGSRDITHTAASTDSDYSGVTATLTATEADTTAGLTSSGVTATGATLTIANITAAWYYKSTTTGKTACTAVDANTASVTLTDLTPGTSYTFTAHSDSACTEGNKTATASAFTTGGVSVSNLANSGIAPNVIRSSQTWGTDFTAGPNPSGYTLHSVTNYLLRSAGTADLVWKIHPKTTNSDNKVVPAETAQATLSGSDPTTQSYDEFIYTCTESQSNDCTLDAGETYFLVGSTTGNGQYFWQYTATLTEILVPTGNGWEIGTSASSSDGGTTWTIYTTDASKFKVSAIPNPTLSATSVTVNSATLTIGNHNVAWWYKRTNPTGDATCHSVAAGTDNAALTALTASTSYTYKAYDKANCADADEIATVTFSTPSS